MNLDAFRNFLLLFGSEFVKTSFGFLIKFKQLDTVVKRAKVLKTRAPHTAEKSEIHSIMISTSIWRN